MLAKIFSLIFILFISFLPLVFWAYIFSYIDSSLLNKKRFFLGIFAGSISVLPFLYFEKIIQIPLFSFLNIFSFAQKITNFSSLFPFFLSAFSFLCLFFFFSFLIWLFFSREEKKFIFSIKTFSLFLIFLLFLSLFFYFLWIFFSLFPELNFLWEEKIYFWKTLFQSFKLIIVYYFLVGLIEESTKYFQLLGSENLATQSSKELVLYSIFIALGFSFIENILYLFNLYSQSWFSTSLIKVYFFRSVFSIILHILCSSIIVHSFAKCWYKYRRFIFREYMKGFFLALVLAIFLHSFFDIALSIGISFVIFLYFMGGYIYVSSIFYREEKRI